ncbi:MAG: GNAT family N-acetyltransferase [Acidimicrobiia bacterium]|nr:GNAT family N-acetyltransferase [Acidimicrobiia bacterium]MDH5503820.1 GNAT family N-acetyltransferase [Acidimicrobiia bacterium]
MISEATTVTDKLVAAFADLIPQLSQSSPPPNREALATIIADPNTHLFVAEDGDAIVGSLTLIIFRSPTGVRARIEDVVVAESARGTGLGRRLTDAAIEQARATGAKAIGLTSRPSREAANGLYQSMGFEQRNTNVYEMKLT